jgi:hypothetical protein
MLLFERGDFSKNKHADVTVMARKRRVATPNKWALEF